MKKCPSHIGFLLPVLTSCAKRPAKSDLNRREITRNDANQVGTRGIRGNVCQTANANERLAWGRSGHEDELFN